jgi:hypothetical protein
MLVLALVWGGCGSPLEPTGVCWTSLSFSLTRNDGSTGSVTYIVTVDGRSYTRDLLDRQRSDLTEVGLLAKDVAGPHVVEVWITAQPSSPASYTVSDVRVQYYGAAGGTLLSCGPVIRTTPLPLLSQTATLATGERLTMSFGL